MQVVEINLHNQLASAAPSTMASKQNPVDTMPSKSLESSPSKQEAADSVDGEFLQDTKNYVEGCLCKLCMGHSQPGGPNSTWKEMVPKALDALTDRDGKAFFQMKKEILPFIDTHWYLLWDREKVDKWPATVGMVLSKYTEIFKSGVAELGVCGYWGLKNVESPVKQKKQVIERSKKRKAFVDATTGSPSQTPTKELVFDDFHQEISLFDALLTAVAEEIPLSAPLTKEECDVFIPSPKRIQIPKPIFA